MGLVNYNEHPTNKRYKVFNFHSLKEADRFEELLRENQIWFERDRGDIKERAIYLFGIAQKDFSKVQRLNFKVSSEFKGRMIKSKFWRYTLVVFFFSVIALGLIGYLKNMQILNEKTKQVEQEIEQK